jgi:hypothetical protein
VAAKQNNLCIDAVAEKLIGKRGFFARPCNEGANNKTRQNQCQWNKSKIDLNLLLLQ